MAFDITPPSRADLERALARFVVPRLSSVSTPEPGALWRAAWDGNVLIAAVLSVQPEQVTVAPVSLGGTPTSIRVADGVFVSLDAPRATPIPAITLDSEIVTNGRITPGTVQDADDHLRRTFWDWSTAHKQSGPSIVPSQLTKVLGVSVPVALDLVRGNRAPTPEQSRVLAEQLPHFFLQSGQPINEQLRATMLRRKYRQPVLSVANRRGVSAAAAWRQSCAAIAAAPLRSSVTSIDWEARADYFFAEVS